MKIKKKSKKRDINELRQTKEYYKPPVSHEYALKERRTICFTKESLEGFLADAIAHLIGEQASELPGLQRDCVNYVKQYLND